MTRNQLARRGLMALFSATTLLLAACGGSGSDSAGTSTLRVLNATSDVTALDLYVGDTKAFSNAGIDALSGNVTQDAATYTLKATTAGSSTTLFSGSYTLSKDKHYTAVVWGRTGSLKLATLPEDESADNITTTGSKIRVFNATTDTGALDVYLTLAGVDDLANATATTTQVSSATLGGYKDVPADTYRLRVTTAGDNTDVRLDVPAITLTAKQHATLIITSGPGGVLVNSAMLIQQGALTQLKNTQARVRVVAGAEARGTVSMLLDNQTSTAGLRSPTVGPYTLVAAGARNVDVRINGTSVSNASRTFAPGGDYTLVAYGDASNGSVTMLSDDNRLPASSRVRIRLISGAANIDPLTLSIDYAALLSDIPMGTGSAFTTAASNSSARVDVTSTSGIEAVYSATDVNLQSQGVYSLFVLGGNASTTTGLPVPTGVLRKDR